MENTGVFPRSWIIGDHTKARRVKEKCRRRVFTSSKQCRTRKFYAMVLHEEQLAKIYQKNLPPIWEPPLQNSTILSKHNFRDLESDLVDFQGRRLIFSNIALRCAIVSGTIILGRQKQHMQSLSQFKANLTLCLLLDSSDFQSLYVWIF